jgi:hypothetical protein
VSGDEDASLHLGLKVHFFREKKG